VTAVSGRKIRRDREEKGSTCMSLVATPSENDGLLAAMDSLGREVMPNGLGLVDSGVSMRLCRRCFC